MILLAHAELDGLICSGRVADGEHTYALMDQRAPAPRRLGRTEALAELALRYFTGHGPATERDQRQLQEPLMVRAHHPSLPLAASSAARSTMIAPGRQAARTRSCRPAHAGQQLAWDLGLPSPIKRLGIGADRIRAVPRLKDPGPAVAVRCPLRI